MNDSLHTVLRALREAAEQAPTIHVELDDDYVRAIERVEARTSNQSGSDKSWVARADRGFRDHYRRATRK